MEKEEIVKYLEHLNGYKRIKIQNTDKERLVFKNSDDVFKVYGSESKHVLTPFNDYTYEWLNSFLYAVIEHINNNDFEVYDELRDSIQDILYEWVDEEVDVYTAGLTDWLGHNGGNIWYLEEAIRENPEADNHLMLAQYKAIEELFNNALNCLIDDLETKFPEDE